MLSRLISLLSLLLVLPCGLQAQQSAGTLGPATGTDDGLSVTDVAWLWPAPRTPEDVTYLLTAADQLNDGQDRLWPAAAFEAVLRTADGLHVASDFGGSEIGITFRRFSEQFQQSVTWRVAAIRFDPCAPGTAPGLMEVFGGRPQVRLTLQPVTVEDGTVHFARFVFLDDELTPCK
jgi:hypothetical protein